MTKKPLTGSMVRIRIRIRSH